MTNRKSPKTVEDLVKYHNFQITLLWTGVGYSAYGQDYKHLEVYDSWAKDPETCIQNLMKVRVPTTRAYHTKTSWGDSKLW